MPCLQSRENAYVRGAEPETKTGGPKAARRLTPRLQEERLLIVSVNRLIYIKSLNDFRDFFYS